MKISVLKNYITQIKCINSWENTKNKSHRNKQKNYEKQSKSKLTSHKEKKSSNICNEYSVSGT